MTNFDFLKKHDKDLYNIVNDAEKLYCGEFFDQCMTQTRRFGEIVCKNVLGSRRTTEITFDAMLATLKDCTIGSSEEAKEFVDDLYFLKKHGNQSAHSVSIKKEGTEALDCLKRAFEVAINYCVYSCGAERTLLKKEYDTELMLTGKKTQSLSEKYAKAKSQNIKKSEKNKQKKQYCSVKSYKTKQQTPIFWYFIGVSGIVSFVIALLLVLI